MTQELPENICGRSVRGSNFFGRTSEIQPILGRLETDNLLLSAPRRVGKTSLMHKLLEEVGPRPGWQAVYIDVSKAQDELAFIKALYQSIADSPGCEHVQSQLRNQKWAGWVKKTTGISIGSASITLQQDGVSDWQVLADSLEKAVFGLPPGRRLLIMVDELSVFLLGLLKQDKERATRFLLWLRSFRQGPASRSNELRWILAGSIGLEPLARRERWSAHINDLFPISLGAFSPELAHDFLQKLGSRYRLEFSAAVRALILQEIGWPIPFYLQLFVSELRKQDVLIPEQAHIKLALESLLGQSARIHFDTWLGRLTEQLSQTDAGIAKKLLSAIAADPQGSSPATLRAALEPHCPVEEREERYHYLLDVLEHDGYLIQYQDRWQFRSPLLRQVWNRWGNR